MSYQRPTKLENVWWIKLWVKDVLSGSILTSGGLEDLGFLAAMLCIAGDCRGLYGWIQANPETPFKHSYLSSRLCIDVETFDRLLQRMIEQGRMRETEIGIEIINYSYYQKEKGSKRGNNETPVEEPKVTWTDETRKARNKAMVHKMVHQDPTLESVAHTAAEIRKSEDRHKQIQCGR